MCLLESRLSIVPFVWACILQEHVIIVHFVNVGYPPNILCVVKAADTYIAVIVLINIVIVVNEMLL